MGANLVVNVISASKNYHVNECIGWTYSTVVLHWLNNDTYKPFVGNRVNKINEFKFINWRDVPTNCNPADFNSRDCPAENLPIEWSEGPP